MAFFAEYRELDEIGIRHNTNKSTSWIQPDGQRATKPDSLLKKYEFSLEKIRIKKGLKILELGVGPDDNIGASVRVWKDYFPDDAEIHVADIKPSARALEQEGFHVHVGDLGDVRMPGRLAATKWDFVLDDASHLWVHQILAFRWLFRALASGGVFICEDLCTSFGHFRRSYSLGLDMQDAASYFGGLSRAACAPYAAQSDEILPSVYRLSDLDHALAKQIHMLAWIANACIVVKR